MYVSNDKGIIEIITPPVNFEFLEYRKDYKILDTFYSSNGNINLLIFENTVNKIFFLYITLDVYVNNEYKYLILYNKQLDVTFKIENIFKNIRYKFCNYIDPLTLCNILYVLEKNMLDNYSLHAKIFKLLQT